MREQFLADICEHPEDDAPRLIYADWLEEEGGKLIEHARVKQYDSDQSARDDLSAACLSRAHSEQPQPAGAR